jgi:steroid delta-isomerase-like uncharacterized protein
MSVEENKAIIRRWLEAEYLRGIQEDESPEVELEQTVRRAVAETFAPECVLHSPEGDVTREEYIQASIRFFSTMPDYSCTIEDTISEGDSVAMRIIMRGTRQDTDLGIPATGKKLEIRAAVIFHFADGKVVEAWRYSDRLSVMQQLGVIPTPGQ